VLLSELSLRVYADSRLNTELEVLLLTIPLNTNQSMLRTQHEQLQIIIVMLACVPGIPWKRHYILSLDCQSTLLLHDSRYDVHHESPQVKVMVTVVVPFTDHR